MPRRLLTALAVAAAAAGGCGGSDERGPGAQGITFWSGGVVAREPACVPLHIWVDAEPVPRRATLRMGVRRCARRPAAAPGVPG